MTRTNTWIRLSVGATVVLAATVGPWDVGLLGAAETAPSNEAPATNRQPPTADQGRLTEKSLGDLLQAMGIQVEKQQQRYDFAFTSTLQEEEWKFSMSAVLSQDGDFVWLMAWLEPLPRSAADVPRTALLRLLADNDRLGNGKFFAYVAANRRFVLQKVVPNRGITTARFRAHLKDLAIGVSQTYSHWAVANWKRTTPESEPSSTPSGKPSGPGKTILPGPRRTPVRNATNKTKFEAPLRK